MTEQDPQARLVASELVATAQAYTALSDRLTNLLDEQPADSTEVMAEVRGEASHLTARAASLAREARAGAFQHAGHGCDYEDAYAGAADFLQWLTESGATLLEVRSLEQVDVDALAHPFAHLMPLLAGPVRHWLLENVDDDQRAELENLISSADQMVPEVNTLNLSFSFGPLPDLPFAEIKTWALGDEETAVSDPLAVVVLEHLVELRTESRNEGLPFRVGQLGDENVLILECEHDLDDIEELMAELEEAGVPYRAVDSDQGTGGIFIYLWLPGLAQGLLRRALPGVDGLRYQLDAQELSQLEEAGVDASDYLELDFHPGTALDEDELTRLAAVAAASWRGDRHEAD